MEIIGIGLVILAASCLQGAIGFGLGMMAAPVLAIIRPDLLPATLILLTVALSVAMFLRERTSVDWRIVMWALIGRIPGVVLGALAVAFLPSAALSLILAAAVLGGVAFSLVGWKPAPTTGNVMIAGAASGLFGTSTSIGGPPIALVMRSLAPSQIRATINAYFTFGTAMSLTGLALGGALTLHHVLAAAWLAPFMVVGLLLSSLVITRISSRALFLIGVIASVLGAAIVIVQAVGALTAG
ncbi:sulfite exporter TauE/SafE family protein [Brevibacterium salitolerans]|uniref:Probable membrane transporter protein n=1 Tax=Brevibacterium salitolerans TaxID=1403566 RepID=A0ABN2X4Q1_9MICO